MHISESFPNLCNLFLGIRSNQIFFNFLQLSPSAGSRSSSKVCSPNSVWSALGLLPLICTIPLHILTQVDWFTLASPRWHNGQPQALPVAAPISPSGPLSPLPCCSSPLLSQDSHQRGRSVHRATSFPRFLPPNTLWAFLLGTYTLHLKSPTRSKSDSCFSHKSRKSEQIRASFHFLRSNSSASIIPFTVRKQQQQTWEIFGFSLVR